MPPLTADDVGGKHSYIKRHLPEWKRSMASIVNEGGPWSCPNCQTASLLPYRCSACGADLAGDTARSAEGTRG